MALIQSSQDHLPYIDADPSPDSLASARALVAAGLPQTTTEHPRLPPPRPSAFSPSITASHTAFSTSSLLPGGIDLSRYEAPSLPSTNDAAALRPVLQAAYASSAYLGARLTNLGLLETYGKNAWLVANSQLEDILRELDKEVAAARADAEDVERERRTVQESGRGEMEGLEREWRERVGRVVETQAAAEGLRREILERRREMV